MILTDCSMVSIRFSMVFIDYSMVSKQQVFR
jgi:hypothetical protein